MTGAVGTLLKSGSAAKIKVDPRKKVIKVPIKINQKILFIVFPPFALINIVYIYQFSFSMISKIDLHAACSAPVEDENVISPSP